MSDGPSREERARRRADAARVRRLLRGVARDVRGSLVAAMLGALVRQAGFLAAPFLLSFAIDDGVAAGDAAAAARWCGAIALAALLQYAGLCVWEHFGNRADALAGVTLRTRVRRGVLAGGGAETLGTGDLVVRSGRDVDLVRVWVHGLPTWAVIAITIAVLVPGFASLDPWLLLVAAATAPCLAVLSIVYPKRFERASGRAAEAHGRRADVVDQIVRAGLGLRGIGAEEAILARHQEASADLARRTVRASGVLARWTAFGEGVPALATAVGVLVGALAVLDGRLSVGSLVTFTGWMATVGIAVQVGLMRWTQGVDAKVGAARLLPVIGDERERRPAVPAPSHLRARGLVPVAGASPVDVDLVPGRLVAVTGPVASGKSMLLRVLAGERPAAAGVLLADGVPVGEARVDGVRLVPQRPLVVTGTVRDNLALGSASGNPVADDERYRAALATVGLDVELSGHGEGMPEDVLDLELGEGGGELSGGQRQRLAFACALMARPRVLLLDDATSAVDPHTAAKLVAAMRGAAREGIVVAAGHDPRLLEEADVVVAMADRAAGNGAGEDADEDRYRARGQVEART